VRHTSAVPIGGDHFTNDLAVGCATPISEPRGSSAARCAASALMKEDARSRSPAGRPPAAHDFAHMLTDHHRAARHGLLSLIRDDLKRAGLDGQIPAGFVMRAVARACTGSTNLRSIASICLCALGSQRAWLICPNRWRSRNMHDCRTCIVWREGAAFRAARGGNLVSKLKAMFAGAS